MKIQWLEKMAEDGQISKEALDIIYHDCKELADNGFFQKEAIDSNALSLIVGGALGTIGMGGVLWGASQIGAATDNAIISAKTQSNRAKIVGNKTFDPKQKEKAEARFNEIVKFAPSLGANEQVMTHLVHKKMNTGLTDHDVQNLIAIQSNFTKDPLEYASLSNERPIRSPMLKTSEEIAGDNLAERVILLTQGLEKQAGVGKFIGAIKPEVKDLLLKAVAPMLLISAGISGAQWAAHKVDEVRLNAQLKNTYKGIMDSSSDSVLVENPQKAQEAFNTLAHFAPHVAIEPNAAKAFMTKLVSYGTGPNATDIRDISEIEKGFRPGDTSSYESLKLVGLPQVLGRHFEAAALKPPSQAEKNLRDRVEFYTE